mmetsp:Transcript_4639/g.5288  ORF Transcript_4639/g.5288 Transcript_4639/m.5288 type:complete len:245 (-) Transcript_4639:34-768(-)
MSHCRLCRCHAADSDGLCTLCRSLHRLTREVLSVPPVLRSWVLDQTRQWSSIVSEELYKFKAAVPKGASAAPGATPKSGAVDHFLAVPKVGTKQPVKAEAAAEVNEEEEEEKTGRPERASSSGVNRPRAPRTPERSRVQRSRSRRRRREEQEEEPSPRKGREASRGKERKRRSESRRERREERRSSREESHREEERRRPREPDHPPRRPGKGKGGYKGRGPKKWTNKGRTKVDKQRRYREQEDW